MRTYARIQEGVIFELLQTEGDIRSMFSSELLWVDVTDYKPMPQERWKCELVDGSYQVTRP